MLQTTDSENQFVVDILTTLRNEKFSADEHANDASYRRASSRYRAAPHRGAGRRGPRGRDRRARPRRHGLPPSPGEDFGARRLHPPDHGRAGGWDDDGRGLRGGLAGALAGARRGRSHRARLSA